MAPIWLLLGLVSLVEADWAEVESTSNGAAFMLQQRAKKQKSPSTKSLVQDDFGFIAATMIYIETAGDVPQRPGVWPRGREKSGTSHRERQEEYCVSIRENAKNRAVQEINLLTTMNASSAWSSLVDTCQLPEDVQKKIKVHASYSERDLTYKTMLSMASAAASPTTLQIVMNTDIILSDKFAKLKTCLNHTVRKNAFFHLTRSEPKSCYPLLDGLPRHRTSQSAPDKNVYLDLCKIKGGFSHDALAFTNAIPPEVLDELDFAPNRLGAENLVSCKLSHAGFNLQNPCSELSIYHNHCSDQRSYSHVRLDIGGDYGRECYGFPVRVTNLSNVCSDV
mmetsp:Transcript_29756/g.53977  ORF Transcript_29756/g.53977 Transcript_29756/m.53977 type:complete len:336 (-) Transcript_29756:209-1216(-)